MSIISSNSLFHFTPTFDTLIGILTNAYLPRFSKESIRFNDSLTEFNIAIGMVCFCDIPLSQIKDHINTYGNYGLGMSKIWATQKELNPVLYLRDNSMMGKLIPQIIRDLSKTTEEGASNVINFLCNIKAYEGSFLRRGATIPKVTFYNEREWRYVPFISKTENAVIVENQYGKVDWAVENEKLKNYKLDFTPSDIRYVIVNNENEILEIVNQLERIKGKYYSFDDVKKLTSRIITSEQILEDF